MGDKFKTKVASQGLTSLGASKLSTEDFSLVVIEGPHKGESLRIEKEIIRIGRTEWCDLVLSEDQWVSSIHCECWLDEKGFRIRDLGSRNGILLAGCPIFDAYLVADAKLRIGNSVLQLKSHHRKRQIDIQYQDDSGRLVGRSPAMRKIFSMLSRLGTRKVPVLLTGETGTGKTSIAHAIHLQSENSKAPFVVVNCGALPASLIEASLFGYEKGAFTGAIAQHQGFFQQANGGTLFLDEIGELPLDLQPKLLDVLERHKIRRLGSEKEHKVDFRLIAATHRTLSTEIEEGRFREDLYFRISVVELEVPPLRERKEDIPLLVNKILNDLAPRQSTQLTKEATRALQQGLWPGNIRQLRNALERSITFLEGDTIQVEDLTLPTHKTNTKLSAPPTQNPTPAPNSVPNQSLPSLPTFPLAEQDPPVALKEVLSNTEKLLIVQALKETNRNVQEASELLGISPAWLYNRIKKYHLSTK